MMSEESVGREMAKIITEVAVFCTLSLLGGGLFALVALTNINWFYPTFLYGAVVYVAVQRYVYFGQYTELDAEGQRTADVENQRDQEAALQRYLDQMTELLIQQSLHEHPPDSVVHTVARAQTLIVLQRLDGSHKRRVVQFLYETQLMNPNGPLRLYYADLREANLERLHLPTSDLRAANLGGANLSGADLNKAYMQGANLRGANLASTLLSDAYLIRTDLTDAFLSYANLSRANLSYANLSYANLSYANLSRANLSYANLRGTSLGEADLSEADLSEADLSEADLSEADLSGARVSAEQLAACRSLNGAIISRVQEYDA